MKKEQQEYMQKLQSELEELGYSFENELILQAFGSVAINGEGVDIDYLMYVPYDAMEKLRNDLVSSGFSPDASYGIYRDGWGSLKKEDRYNIILYVDKELFEKQQKAFNICVQMQEIAQSPVPKCLRRAIHEFLRGEYVPTTDFKELLLTWWIINTCSLLLLWFPLLQ